MVAPAPNHLEWFYSLRGDYNAFKQSRFRRRRTGIRQNGSGADFHYQSESDFLRLMEIARDVDRNDVVVGQATSRLASNVIRDGFIYNPKTGDKAIDADLKARQKDWEENASDCDAAGERTWPEICHDVFRNMLVDGDIFGYVMDSGHVEIFEAHRCRTPTWGKNKNIVHGVEQDKMRRRHRFHFTTEDIAPLATVKKNQITAKSATDESGERRVVQMYLPRRFSQSRGVSAYAPIVDPASQHDDISFAKLVQQQIASFFAIIRERPLQAAPGTKRRSLGPQTTEQVDSTSRILEKFYPGMEFRGERGEQLKAFSPNIPNPEFFDHVRLVLTYIAVNLDLPLITLLLDATATNFTGWRGAIDQARMRWRYFQNRLCDRWCRPIQRQNILRWMREDRALDAAQARDGINLFGFTYGLPGWPYIQPLQDASADLMISRNGLSSRRRVQAKNGAVWEEVSTEIVEDNGMAIEKAILEARRLNDLYEEAKLDWREVLNYPTPDGIQVAVSGADSGDANQPGQQPRRQPQPAQIKVLT